MEINAIILWMRFDAQNSVVLGDGVDLDGA